MSGRSVHFNNGRPKKKKFDGPERSKVQGFDNAQSRYTLNFWQVENQRFFMGSEWKELEIPNATSLVVEVSFPGFCVWLCKYVERGQLLRE